MVSFSAASAATSTEEMTERYGSVAQAEVQAALGKVVLPRSAAELRWWEETKWWESGGKADHDSNHRRRITVASTCYELAFRERDIGFEPTTFSLGKRKRPFQAVTGSAK